MKEIFALIMSVIMTSTLTGCSTKVSAADLTEGITPNITEINAVTDDSAAAVTDFAVRLFKESREDGKNTLISPYSVLSAMAMTANGAKGDTLSQMEQTFGLDRNELNTFMRDYKAALPSDEKCKFNIANSIWFRNTDGFNINKDFLQTNADYYGAQIYKAAFDDSTLKDINNWVDNNTDGMIKNILDEIPEDAVTYLINALAFDGEWEEIYKKSEVVDGTFTKEDGTKQNAVMMYSDESTYLKDTNAVGFIKPYKGGKYAFAALLPDEGTTVSEYVDTLTGEKLRTVLENAEKTSVDVALPKFKSEYSVKMNDILISMGITDAFDKNKADFSALGTADGVLYISRVLHKTYIEVDEKGTKAGAATAVEITNECAVEYPNIVHLDRPFVYMIIDTENNIPIFIGTVSSLE